MSIEIPISGDMSLRKQFDDILTQMDLGGEVGKKSGNFKGQTIEHTFTGATEEVIEHKLNRVPQGYIMTQKNANTTVYNGTTAWTSTNLYLVSSAGAATVRIIVW
jgi:hypothetical protein